MTALATVLIAVTDPILLEVVGRFIAAPGRTVLTTGNAQEARTLAEAQGPIDVALLDRNLEDGCGLELAAELKRRRPETEAILVTEYATFESAVEALQVGLYDYVAKPIDDFEALRLKVDNALAKVRLAEERRAAEASLRHLQMMDAIGTMASGLGHDLANMLSVIRGWADELEVETTGNVREGLAEIRGAAERATRLVRQMAMLSRKAPAQSQSVSPNHALEELAGLLRRSVGERVTLRLELAPEPWPVLVDPSQLGQIFLNLAVNARDAMRTGGGTLTFRTENVAAGVERPEGLPPGDCVVLSVSDEGAGIPEAVRERIFEPFFTTKPPGQGTGLGLAIVHGIVRQAGGTIRVRSAPAQGTTFVIALPRAPEAAGPSLSATAQGPAPEPPSAEATALVVHRDPQLRSVLGRALRRASFQVIEVQDPGQVLAVARAHPGAIDVLVSGAIIPGSSGPALAGVLRRERPDLRAIVLSGFEADPAVKAFASEGGEVLQEPFQPAEVVEAARKVLARA